MTRFGLKLGKLHMYEKLVMIFQFFFLPTVSNVTLNYYYKSQTSINLTVECNYSFN